MVDTVGTSLLHLPPVAWSRLLQTSKFRRLSAKSAGMC